MTTFSVFAGHNGIAHIYVYTWKDLDTTGSGSTTILRHLWNMGYDAGAYLNNMAPNMHKNLPTFQINVIASHGEPGVAILCSETNVSCLVANASASGYHRSISTLSSNSLSTMRIFLYMTCYSGLTSPQYGNLVTETRNKGARCVVGWNGEIYNDSANDWLRLLFEKADKEHDVLWECFNHADYWVRDIFGDEDADLLKDRHEKGNINQYLYDIPD